jgi:phage antirepressor YoqD-like protein
MLTLQDAAARAGLMPFHFEGREIRVFADDTGELWFVALDVAETLGYNWQSNAIAHVPADWKGIRPINTPGGRQQMSVLSEQGLYFFLGRSDKPKALPFQRWLAGDVVPQIRRTGSYSPAPALPRTFAEALRLAADQQETIEAQAAELVAAAPAVEFVGRYVDSTGLKGFRQVAKLLGAKENLFRDFLIEEKILYRLNGELTPHSQHIDAGRFCVKAGTAENSGHAFNSARFTPKGVNWVAGEWAKWQLKQRGEGAHV